MDTSHWIGSVKFELRSTEPGALDPVRNMIRQEYEAIVVRPLHRALDRVDRPGRVSRHGKIELDLGVIRPGGFGEALERQIAESLLARLDWDSDPGMGGASSSGIVELLLSFLESGQLGWPAPGKALEAIFVSISTFEAAEMAGLAEKLRVLVERHPVAALRFTTQCPLEIVLAVIGALAGLEHVRGVDRGSRALTHYVGEREAKRLASLLLEFANGASGSPEELNWLGVMMSGASWAGPTPVDGGTPSVPRAPPAPVGVHVARPPAARTDPRLEPSERAAGDSASDLGYPAEAAGLVLLHPFVGAFMGTCGLLDENGAFRSEEERARGILLLYLVATGRSEAPEPELLLAKLLLGGDIALPVPRSIEPTAGELAQVEAMLKAAIAHWTALGDSSIEALRETFLLRPGRFVRAGEEWRLKIEARGVDVLIDRLPWSISLVLTPFMARPLRVDWR